MSISMDPQHSSSLFKGQQTSQQKPLPKRKPGTTSSPAQSASIMSADSGQKIVSDCTRPANRLGRPRNELSGMLRPLRHALSMICQ